MTQSAFLQSFCNLQSAICIARRPVFARLLKPARTRPPQPAGARVKVRGLSILDRTFTATQDEPVVGGGRHVAAEHTAGRDGKTVIAAGREPQCARAVERFRGALAVVVALCQQDAELVARPAGAVFAEAVLQEVQVQAGIAPVSRARLLPERCPLPRMLVAQVPGRTHGG